jgi:hypothetical protein
VQQELDEKRGAYAERLRAVRGATNSQKSSKKREKRKEGHTQRDSTLGILGAIISQKSSRSKQRVAYA